MQDSSPKLSVEDRCSPKLRSSFLFLYHSKPEHLFCQLSYQTLVRFLVVFLSSHSPSICCWMLFHCILLSLFCCRYIIAPNHYRVNGFRENIFRFLITYILYKYLLAFLFSFRTHIEVSLSLIWYPYNSPQYYSAFLYLTKKLSSFLIVLD